MAAAVAHFMREIGTETMAEGDVYITNDPWMGTGHLHDITVVTPVFHGGALVAYFGCTAHVVDIGGRGFGADGESVYEEGLQIPIMRFADMGKVNGTLLQMLRVNTREPDQVIGDIYAAGACNEVGLRRLGSMLAEYALPDIEALADFIVDASHAATVEAIARLPKARASSTMTTDGYATPITLACTVETHPDHVLVDFSGTSPPDPKGINVPFIYTCAYAAYALKIAIAPEVPNNAGSLAPFRVTAPEDTIVNARRPHPVALRHVIGHLIPDTVFGAFDQIVPNTVPAEGAGALCNFQVSLRGPNGERSEVLTFNSGGTGARPALDGLNATAFPSGVMTMPVEATEHAGPIVIHRKELRSDSGGAGGSVGAWDSTWRWVRATATPWSSVPSSTQALPGPRPPGRLPRRAHRGAALRRHRLPGQGPLPRARGADRPPRVPGGGGHGPGLGARPPGRRPRRPPGLRQRGGRAPRLRLGAVNHASYDVVIVGGAMIGSSVAWWTLRDPEFRGAASSWWSATPPTPRPPRRCRIPASAISSARR
jgi:N-methylhydantoinase B